MSNFTDFIAPAVALFFFIAFFPRYKIWSRLCKLRYGTGSVSWIEKDQIPQDLAPIFSEAEKAMDALGFQFLNAGVFKHVLESEPQVFGHVYFHPHYDTYAMVLPPNKPDGRVPFQVQFETLFEDGTVLATVDGLAHFMIESPGWYDVHDHYLGDYLQQWEAHQKACADKTDCQVVSASFESYSLMQDRYFQNYVPHLLDQKWIVPAESPDRWKLLPGKAWTWSARAMEGHKKFIMSSRNKKETARAFSQDSIIAADVDAYERHEAVEEYFRDHDTGKAVRFFLSAAAFVAAFSWLWSFSFALILLVVIFIHEMGHYLAMTLLGYRNRQVFFVPFFGAATMGRKEDAKVLQRFWVLLAGPLPGLFIGWGLVYVYQITQTELWFEAGMVFLVINYLNLLPVTPFDGGRILDTLYFDRFPRFQVLFFVASLGVMLLGGIVTGEPLLFILPVLLSLSIPTRWQMGNVAKQAKGALPPNPSDAIVKRMVFKALLQGPMGKKPFQSRQSAAGSLVQSIQAPRPEGGEVVGGTIFYLGALIVPFVLFAMLGFVAGPSV